MLAALIRFSLSQRLLVFLGVLLLIGGGMLAVLRTPIDAYPDISTTQVKMVVKAAGLTPRRWKRGSARRSKSRCWAFLIR